MADTAIAPMPHAIGINMSFVAQQPTFLVLKERMSFSGDDFTIQTANGQNVVRCEGKAMSISGRKCKSQSWVRHSLKHEAFAVNFGIIQDPCRRQT